MSKIKSRAAYIEIYKNCINDEGCLETALECLRDSESTFIIDKKYHSIEELVIDLFDQDNVYLFTNGSYDINWDLIFEDFEESDNADNSDEHSNYEEAYGEEGTNSYILYTKNKINRFYETTPFGDGKSYEGAELR
jgi:hypothetical protein